MVIIASLAYVLQLLHLFFCSCATVYPNLHILMLFCGCADNKNNGIQHIDVLLLCMVGPDADAGILPRSLNVIFSSIDEQLFPGMSIKPHRCREFTNLTREQQTEEALFKRNLFRQLKEVPYYVSMLPDLWQKN